MFPGSNLLNQAFRAIRPIEVQYAAYHDRTLNEEGIWVSTYKKPVPVMASVQAVNRDRYERMGLNFANNYFMLYLSEDVGDLQRDTTPDRFLLPNGRTYDVVSENDWFGADGMWATGISGWVGVLVVELARNEVTLYHEEEDTPLP